MKNSFIEAKKDHNVKIHFPEEVIKQISTWRFKNIITNHLPALRENLMFATVFCVIDLDHPSAFTESLTLRIRIVFEDGCERTQDYVDKVILDFYHKIQERITEDLSYV